MSNDDTGKQAGSYLDKPGNQGPMDRFFSISDRFGSGIREKNWVAGKFRSENGRFWPKVTKNGNLSGISKF